MKLTKLSSEQIARKKEIKDYWINLVLHSKDDVDIAKIEKYLPKLYRFQERLPKIKILSSPLGIQLFLNLMIRKKKLNEVGNEVGNEVWNEVWNEVGSEVRNEVWNEVGSEVRNEVWNEVGSEVGKKKMKYYVFSWVNLSNVGWVSFYDFFRKQNIHKKETEQKLSDYIDFLHSGVFMSVYMNKYAVFCRRPVLVKKNELGRIHSDNSPALKWRDGYSIYALNGVRFPKELWEKTVNKKLTNEEFFSIQDVDQRTQALKYMGEEFFIEQAKGIKISEYVKYYANIKGQYRLVEKNNPLAIASHYELYKFPKGNIFREDAYYAFFTCPSTNKKHLEGVEKCDTIQEAMAWAISEESLGIVVSPEQWEGMTPLADET